MDENKIKEISCAFFRYWWNSKGNNTEQGFDEWWNDTGKSLVDSDCISHVSNRCEHCKSNRVTVGEGGLWCEDCGRLTKKK